MTPLTAIWIASLAGALLFFAAGFLLARRHLGEAAAVDAAIPPRVPPPVVESSPPIAAADPAQPYATAAILRLQVGELRQALQDARLREQSYADVERELHRLRRERTDFEVTTKRELSFEVDVAVRQMGELERLRHENAALRRQLGGAGEKPIQAETDERHQPGTVTITGNPIGTTRPRMIRPASAPLGRSGEQRSTADQLSSLLARLRNRSVRAIALADELGLPIVGIGDDNASLAAFASYVTDVGRKTREFLPLGPLRRVTVEDENDSTVTTCALAAGDAHLALITLTVGPGPSARQMGDVLRAAASMMR
jgi:predicted regulator of Ras-like GTPase activity (Roadblock/LC7/MglB family)